MTKISQEELDECFTNGQKNEKFIKQLRKKLLNFNRINSENFISRFMKHNERIECMECNIDKYINHCMITICCAKLFSCSYILTEKIAYSRLCNEVINLKDSLYKVIAYAVGCDKLREKLLNIEDDVQQYIEKKNSYPSLFEYVSDNSYRTECLITIKKPECFKFYSYNNIEKQAYLTLVNEVIDLEKNFDVESEKSISSLIEGSFLLKKYKENWSYIKMQIDKYIDLKKTSDLFVNCNDDHYDDDDDHDDHDDNDNDDDNDCEKNVQSSIDVS